MKRHRRAKSRPDNRLDWRDHNMLIEWIINGVYYRFSPEEFRQVCEASINSPGDFAQYWRNDPTYHLARGRKNGY